MISSQLLASFQRLQNLQSRSDAAAALATSAGAERVLLFVNDLEVKAFLPAVGMPQTLPDAAAWQKFLQECAQAGQASGVLTSPGKNASLPSFGIADADRLCILVFMGATPDAARTDEIRQLLPLLAGKLIDERVAVWATGHALAAREATRQAQELNAALEKIRFQLKESVAVAQQELAQRRLAENKLMEADRHKNNFLATLAHELRNPLGAISIAVELQEMLERGTLSGPAADARKTIKRQTALLTHMVNDLLDVSRVSQGKVALKREQVAIGDCVEAACDLVRSLMDTHQHALQVNLADPAFRICADFTRMTQIIGNLLENSAKYTPKGGRIVLDVKVDQDQLTIAVTDNGIGFRQEAHDHLFTIFSQSDRVEGRVADGLGIGLSLVKQFVELHGGEVFAASVGPGCGSVFTVRMPTGVDTTEGWVAGESAPRGPEPSGMSRHESASA